MPKKTSASLNNTFTDATESTSYMSEKIIINSKEYWDHRFATNWEENSGTAQSRFFAQLAVEAMPEWIRQVVRRDALRVCDWGCAHGDGTDYLMRALGWNMTGVDFSTTAIQEAKRRYPAIDFRCEDWLTQTPRNMFDVVFSSNTLEHFSDPWGVFEKISHFATKFMVLLLPYEEYIRHVEHAATFDANRIPLAPTEHWLLVQSKVIDASIRTPSFWPGLQILLIYVRNKEISRYRIMLADAELASNQKAQEMAQQREKELQGELASLLAQKDALAAELASSQKAQEMADAQVRMLRFQIDTMLATLSWRWTRPLRLIRGIQLRAGRRVAAVVRAYRRGGISYVLSKAAAVLHRRSSVSALPVSVATSLSAEKDALVAELASSQKAQEMAQQREKELQGELALLSDASDGEIMPASTTLQDIYIFAVIDWNFRIQRPQHLARSLAQLGHRVFYLTNHFSDASSPGYVVEKLDPNLPIYQIRLNVLGAPAIYFGAPTAEAVQQIDSGLRHLRAHTGWHSLICLVQHAYWARSAAALQAECLIYDCMDDHEGFGNVPSELVELEDWILHRADLVITTSTPLERKASQKNSRVVVIRNAAQFSDFSTRPAAIYTDPLRRKIIGYYGAIAEWFDVELIRQIALAFPEYLILLVGADTVDARGKLKELGNVVFISEVSYKELPFYLYAFDVCLLPFKVIPLTLATNPVKVYEYLSAGRSVVAVDLPELSQFSGLVRTAKDHPRFIAELREALAENQNDVALIQKRKNFASGQTWEHRARQFEAAIACVPKPRVSVIVLTCNNLPLTVDCLKSLDTCRQGVELELIVVDNASSDDTPQFLREWSAGRHDVRLILNPINAGFAAGNNIGLAAATGDYLVILNNDTVVTPWWAWRLVNHLRNDASIGLVGPVTNNIGNEAKVTTSYATLDAMLTEAECLTRINLGRTFEIRTLAFFCVMLPRLTYELCGPLCEDYGLGFFEDDDYCRRVQAAGLRIVCAEDVFVHHHLSASFDKLGCKRKQNLFENNKAIYEKKWGAWIPHVYRK